MNLETVWTLAVRIPSLTLGLWLIFVMVPVVWHDWKFLETWKKYRESALVLFAVYCISAVIEGTQRDITPGFSAALRLGVLILLGLGVTSERTAEKKPPLEPTT